MCNTRPGHWYSGRDRIHHCVPVWKGWLDRGLVRTEYCTKRSRLFKIFVNGLWEGKTKLVLQCSVSRASPYLTYIDCVPIMLTYHNFWTHLTDILWYLATLLLKVRVDWYPLTFINKLLIEHEGLPSILYYPTISTPYKSTPSCLKGMGWWCDFNVSPWSGLRTWTQSPSNRGVEPESMVYEPESKSYGWEPVSMVYEPVSMVVLWF